VHKTNNQSILSLLFRLTCLAGITAFVQSVQDQEGVVGGGYDAEEFQCGPGQGGGGGQGQGGGGEAEADPSGGGGKARGGRRSTG
jgi:hypothetical protein